MKTYYYILIGLFFIIGCTKQEEKSQPEMQQSGVTNTVTITDIQKKNANIQVGLPIRKAMLKTLRVNGSVEVPPQSILSVGTSLGGYIKTISVQEGDFVQKGQLLLTLEDISFIQLQQEYLTAKTKLEYAEKEWQRQAELNKSKTSSDKTTQLSQAELQMQKVTVNSLAEKLRLIGIEPSKLNENSISSSIKIVAHNGGYVSAIRGNTGKYINAGENIVDIINPSTMYATLTVFEKDIPEISVGQKVRLILSNKTNDYFDSEIVRITHTLDEHRSIRVICSLPSENNTILPGMFLTASIEIPKENCIVVPEEAIVRQGKEVFVFAEQQNGNYSLLNIQTGIIEHGEAEIIPREQNVDLTTVKIVMKGAYSLLGVMNNKGEE